jgi:hypothetical protein
MRALAELGRLPKTTRKTKKSLLCTASRLLTGSEKKVTIPLLTGPRVQVFFNKLTGNLCGDSRRSKAVNAIDDRVTNSQLKQLLICSFVLKV